MFRNNMFIQVVYLEHGASGSGSSADDALPIAAGELFSVPEGVVIDNADFHVDVAITGSTAIDVGDGADPDGYIDALDITYGTPGVYAGTGALLGAKKYAAGDTIDMAVTGTSTAGKAVVVLSGYRV